MSGIIDTNILLYAANSNAAEHEIARQWLTNSGVSPDTRYLTEGIVYEFLRVSTHPKVFPSPLTWQQSLAFLRPILASSSIRVLTASPEHWDILEKVSRELNYPAGNLFFDIRTAVLMREHGIRRIYTTDTDFLQFSEIQVVNPLRRTSPDAF